MDTAIQPVESVLRCNGSFCDRIIDHLVLVCNFQMLDMSSWTLKTNIIIHMWYTNLPIPHTLLLKDIHFLLFYYTQWKTNKISWRAVWVISRNVYKLTKTTCIPILELNHFFCLYWRHSSEPFRNGPYLLHPIFNFFLSYPQKIHIFCSMLSFYLQSRAYDLYRGYCTILLKDVTAVFDPVRFCRD